MRTVLLTLGRLPKALDLARSFARAGWRVLVADPFKTHLLGVSRAVAKSFQVPSPAHHGEAYLDALDAIVRRERIELVLPVSVEIMHVAQLRERLPDGVRLFAMAQDALQMAHDKLLFARHAASLGLRVPPTARADDPAALDVAQMGDFVVKERHSCGGGGVSFFARGAAFPRVDHALVQARIRGPEFSSCTLAHAGRVRATAVYRATMTSGTVAVGFERIDDAAIADWIARYVAATAWTGFISFDFLKESDGAPLAIECNPRLTSGVHFFQTADLAPALLDPAAPVRLRPERRLQQFWSSLQEAQRALPNLARLGHVFGTRDVTWSAADPLPLLTMPWTARELLRRAARGRVPLSVAATSDLNWSPQS